MANYKALYEILNRAGVRTPRDLERLKHRPRGSTGPPTGVSSIDYGWVSDLFEQTKVNLSDEIDRLQGLKGSVVCFPYEPDRVTDFTFHEIRAKYSCYLPDLSVHVCGALLQQETESSGYEYFVYYDYLYLLLRLKPLMMQNMATVVPRRYAIYDWRFDYGNTRKSIHEVYDRQQVIDIDILKPPNVPHVFQGKKEISELLPGAFALPYLEKIDLERYVDIVQKNRDLFAKISNEFRNSLEKEGGDFITAWVHAYNDALVDIQIAYEKAVKELNRNGISATVGLAITAFSLWMPGLSEAARAALAAIGSSKTIADGLGWIGDLRRLPESLRDKAGWLLWKSQRK